MSNELVVSRFTRENCGSNVEIAKQRESLRVGECVDNRQSLILAIVGETDSSANGHPVFLAELTSNRWGSRGEEEEEEKGGGNHYQLGLRITQHRDSTLFPRFFSRDCVPVDRFSSSSSLSLSFPSHFLERKKKKKKNLVLEERRIVLEIEPMNRKFYINRAIRTKRETLERRVGRKGTFSSGEMLSEKEAAPRRSSKYVDSTARASVFLSNS